MSFLSFASFRSQVSPGFHRRFILLAALAAALACLLLNRFVLGATPHGWDAAAYYFQAQIFASGRVVAPGTPLIDCFWLGNLVNSAASRYAMYPPGWPALLAVAMALRIPALANAAMAGVCLALTSALAGRMFGAREGRIAAALALLSPFFLFMGADFIAHAASAAALAAMLLAMMRSVGAAERMEQRDARERAQKSECGASRSQDAEQADARKWARAQWAWGAAAGAACAVAFLVRPFSAALGLAGAAWITAWTVSWRPARWWRLAVVSLPIMLAAVGIFLAYDAATTGSPWITPYRRAVPDLNLLGMKGEFRASVFANLAANLPKVLHGLHRFVWGGPVTDLGPLAALILLAPRRRETWALAGAIAIYCFGHSLYFYFDFYYGPRMIFETMPWVLAAAAGGIGTLWDRAARWDANGGAGARGAAAKQGASAEPRAPPEPRDPTAPQADEADAQSRMGRIAVTLLYGICELWNLAAAWPARIRYYAANYCGQGGELLRILSEAQLDDALVILRTTNPTAFANVSHLNAPDLREGRVVFARYVPGRVEALRAAFPRRETWILDVEYKEILGENEYADRFRILTSRWTPLAGQGAEPYSSAFSARSGR